MGSTTKHGNPQLRCSMVELAGRVIVVKIKEKEQARLSLRIGREASSGVDLQSAADSAHRSLAPRRRAHSRDAAGAGPAVPRRHSASARSKMGGYPEPRGDYSLGRDLPLRGCDDQLLGFGRPQILSLRLHGRMSSRPVRTGVDPVGGDATGAALHAQPLADFDHHPRRDGAFALWSLANLARMARLGVRYVVAADCRCGRFPGTWSHHARLLRDLFSRSSVATWTARQASRLSELAINHCGENSYQTGLLGFRSLQEHSESIWLVPVPEAHAAMRISKLIWQQLRLEQEAPPFVTC